jgi:hypothetical protein
MTCSWTSSINFTTYLLNIQLNATLPSPSGFPKWIFPECHIKILYVFLISVISATCPAHSSLLDFTILTV